MVIAITGMGRKKKSDGWLPADPLRIRAFAYSLVPDISSIYLERRVNASDIQRALEGSPREQPLEDSTINYWLAGENCPSPVNIKDIQQVFPRCADWLETDIDSSPIRRFLCALDIWGSPIDSPIRKLDPVPKGIADGRGLTVLAKSKCLTVGKGLTILAKRWASAAKFSQGNAFLGCTIPRLDCRVPRQV